MSIGWPQILIIAIVAIILFGGRGKIPALMGDMAKGINSFKKGLKDEDPDNTETIEAQASEVVNKTKDESKAS